MRYFISFIVLFIPITVLAQSIPPDLLKKADTGDPKAQFDVGQMYYEGNGIPRDYKKAAEWYLKAAEQGDVAAQNNLVILYADGYGVPQDYG
jgi:TPR repeat protein